MKSGACRRFLMENDHSNHCPPNKFQISAVDLAGPRTSHSYSFFRALILLQDIIEADRFKERQAGLRPPLDVCLDESH